MCAWRNTGVDGAPGAAERRGLGLLVEGVAINQPQIDLSAYRRFRSAILRDSIRLSEPQSETDLLGTIAAIVHEFETYRQESESAVEARQNEWRHLTGMLWNMLAQRDSGDLSSRSAETVAANLASAVTVEEIESLRATLQALFQLASEDHTIRQAIEDEEQDRSTANDNAAGLRGGGAAIEHVRAMLAASRPGYVGFFRLSCLDVVGERFGPEGIQDCLMAVSAFLIQNMRAEDTVYHWSESSLLAVCDRKVREDMVAAELNRVLARNRDFTINIGDRAIMLRIPIELQLFPVNHFESADDLQKLSASRGRGERARPDRSSAR